MKAKVYDSKGQGKKEKELPNVFEETYRPDLIKRAHLSIKSSKYQPKGTDEKAGLKNTAEYVGRRRAYLTTINRGWARLPRLKSALGREVRKVPQARGGKRAHPPKPEKKQKEHINRKERRKALKSAIAATADKKTVKERGHKIDDMKLPLIADNELESFKKTKKVVEFLKNIKLGEDMEKSKEKKVKQGKGKLRGRKYKRRKSALIVTEKDKGIKRAARNIPGVEAVLTKELNVNHLAPGGQPGRLTIYTENAINKLNSDKDD